LKADAYAEGFGIVFTVLEKKGATAIVKIADAPAALLTRRGAPFPVTRWNSSRAS